RGPPTRPAFLAAAESGSGLARLPPLRALSARPTPPPNPGDLPETPPRRRRTPPSPPTNPLLPGLPPQSGPDHKKTAMFLDRCLACARLGRLHDVSTAAAPGHREGLCRLALDRDQPGRGSLPGGPGLDRPPPVCPGGP